MAVHYIPPAYQQRPRRTGWDMMLPQMAQALFGSILQERAWGKRFGTQQEVATKALGEQRGYEERLWKERYTKPIPVKETGGIILGQKYYAPPKPTDKETWGPLSWNKEMNAFTVTSSRGGIKKFTKEGWKAMTKEEAMGLRKAGAPSMTQIIAQETHGIKKRISASDRRLTLLEDANKKEVFDTEADDFNVMSPSEVAYWDPSPRKWPRKAGLTKFTKLTKKNFADGWTPKAVQEFAEHNNMTVYQVLKKIGAIR